MFADEIRRAIEASPRMKLPEVAAWLWKAFADGQVTEAQAGTLSELIEARKVVPVAPEAPKRRVGSRPRTDASMKRRRLWAASGRLPPTIAACFTLAEQAVLALVAVEVVEKGSCQLPVGQIAALAGVSEGSVRNALREARSLQLLTVEERRVSAWRNDTNVVRISSTEWLSWLRLVRRGGGCKSVLGTNTDRSRTPPKRSSDPKKSCRRTGSDFDRERPGEHPRASSRPRRFGSYGDTPKTTSTSSTR